MATWPEPRAAAAAAPSDTAPSLRTAHEGDQPALAALWRAAWASANPQARTVEPPAHWLARVQAEFMPPAEVLVLDAGEAGGRVLAFMVIDAGASYLAQLFVEPGAMGRGLGRRLLDEACRRMPGGWHLHVATANMGARRFYERRGLEAGPASLNPATGRERVEYRWVPAAF